MEAHLRALSIWDRLIGAVIVMSGLWILIKSVEPDANSLWSGIPWFLFGSYYLVCGHLLYLTGHFLARGSNKARLAAIALTAMQLLRIVSDLAAIEGGMDVLAVLLQVAWVVAILWALLNKRAVRLCTEEYRQHVLATSYVQIPTFKTPFFWIPVVLVSLFFILLLALISMMFGVIR